MGEQSAYVGGGTKSYAQPASPDFPQDTPDNKLLKQQSYESLNKSRDSVVGKKQHARLTQTK